ncbi:uncharacterized protein LOC143285636 [Babylonia areolata]|uniref:uncharacterized protein LOC143285636 n=1 Tax=Babylonia areolata TaxID=304850 RepID=UPI003FD53586
MFRRKTVDISTPSSAGVYRPNASDSLEMTQGRSNPAFTLDPAELQEECSPSVLGSTSRSVADPGNRHDNNSNNSSSGISSIEEIVDDQTDESGTAGGGGNAG